ncbi:hypothetical protein ACJDTP_19550 [Clostridium sp. WILCCON 0112]|uniref:Uncharacterized protein n=1 Tax=Candidatus Clostridium helianthi TaxID=3381660 RepID=A0ABW8S9C3_9CLOT
MEESLGYNSNPSATTDTDEFLYEENKCNENTEPYQSNCSDGSNSIDNLEIKESKHKDLPIKVVGYYKNKSLLDAAKDKTINSVKKIKNKFNF